MKINRACLVDQMKRGPSLAGGIDGGGTRRYNMSSRNVWRACMGEKVRFSRFWVNLLKSKAKEGFVMM